MRKIELYFGKYDRARTVFRVISIEFEITPDITSLEELESYIRPNGDFRVEIRYANEPYGEAAICLEQVLDLFERLKNELGVEHFDYVLLPREQVTLDFSKCKYITEVYDQMRKKMDWEDWYGFNLDALWDILTGLPYKGDDFVILRPRAYSGIPHGKNREFTEAVDKICQIFEEAQTTYGEITVKLQYTDALDDVSDYIV